MPLLKNSTLLRQYDGSATRATMHIHLDLYQVPSAELERKIKEGMEKMLIDLMKTRQGLNGVERIRSSTTIDLVQSPNVTPLPSPTTPPRTPEYDADESDVDSDDAIPFLEEIIDESDDEMEVDNHEMDEVPEFVVNHDGLRDDERTRSPQVTYNLDVVSPRTQRRFWLNFNKRNRISPI